jgi:RNA polymerase sigma-70 factor (ECF subfamily)
MPLPARRGQVEKLVAEHYASLYRYAYRLSGSAADAEDLTQEAFCSAQAKWSQLRDRNRVRGWLFSIVRNSYLHRTRDDRRQKFIPLESVLDIADNAPDPLPDIDADQLQRALNELPESFRTPIILYYFDDFSYRDIAEQMDLPIGTVMSRLARAKGHLRARLVSNVEPVPHSTRRLTDGL